MTPGGGGEGGGRGGGGGGGEGEGKEGRGEGGGSDVLATTLREPRDVPFPAEKRGPPSV